MLYSVGARGNCSDRFSRVEEGKKIFFFRRRIAASAMDSTPSESHVASTANAARSFMSRFETIRQRQRPRRSPTRPCVHSGNQIVKAESSSSSSESVDQDDLATADFLTHMHALDEEDLGDNTLPFGGLMAEEGSASAPPSPSSPSLDVFDDAAVGPVDTSPSRPEPPHGVEIPEALRDLPEGQPVVVGQTETTASFLAEDNVDGIPPEYSRMYYHLRKRRPVLAVEIPMVAFGNDLFAEVESAESISMIDHNNLRNYYLKPILMLLARLCSLGSANTESIRKNRTREARERPFLGKVLKESDLFDSRAESPRFDPLFCTHPMYTNMLSQKKTFTFREEIVLGYEEGEEVDVSSAQASVDRRHDPDFQPPVPGRADESLGSEDTEESSNEAEAETVTEEAPRRRVRRKKIQVRVVKDVPQFSVLWEELVDNEFQPKGWRFWILVNDPAINLGAHLQYVLKENERIANSSSQGRSGQIARDKEPSSHKCYTRFNNIVYRDKGLRKNPSMGRNHPMKKILASEPALPWHERTNNPFHPDNAFNAYHCVLHGPVANVCRAQRDPTLYFNFEAIGIRSIGGFDSIQHLSEPDSMKNSQFILPPFCESFPFPILTHSMNMLYMEPENLFHFPIPIHIRIKAFCKEDVARQLAAVSPQLQDSSIVPPGSYFPNPLRYNTDERMTSYEDWQRFFEEARYNQEQAWAHDDMHYQTAREFYHREHRQKGKDPLSDLSINDRDKKKLYERDALLRFNVWASTQIEELKNEYKDKPAKEREIALVNLKKSLLTSMEEVEKLADSENSQIPDSYATGWKWNRELSGKDQWPDFNASIRKSDSGNAATPFLNMVVQFYDGCKDLFFLNEGEVQHSLFRTVLSRNTALRLSFGIKGNVIMWGPAGASKSHVLKSVERISCPGHILNLTHLTENTFNTGDNMSYVCIMLHEGESIVLGVDKKTGKETAGDATLKNLLTSQLSVTYMCHVEDGQRKQVSSVAMVMCSMIVCNNYILPPESNPMQSRFLRDIIPVVQKAKPTAALAADEDNDYIRAGETTRTIQVRRFRLWHWLCHKVERMIGGVFEDVNMNTFNVRMILFSQWMKERCRIPVRKQNMFKVCGRSLVIMYAVYAHFFTESGRSALKVVSSQGRCRPRVNTDFLGIEKFLVFTDEMFTFLMTLYQRFYLPIIEYEVTQAIMAFLRGNMLLHPTMPSKRNGTTITDVSRWFGQNGQYRGRRAITRGERGSNLTPSRMEEEIESEDSAQELLNRDLHERWTDRDMYHQDENMVYPEREPNPLRSTDPDELLRELSASHNRERRRRRGGGGLESEEPSVNANNSALGGSAPSVSRMGRTSVSAPSCRSIDRNYAFLWGKKKHEILKSIKGHMSTTFADGAVFAVLSSLQDRSYESDDLNESRPGKKQKFKMMRWMRNVVPYYGRGPKNGDDKSGYYINIACLFQYFKPLDMESELSRFMSHAYAIPTSHITALPWKNEPGYLSILKVVEVKRDESRLLVKENAIPANQIHNKTVYNSLVEEDCLYEITKEMAAPIFAVDMDMDILSFYQAYIAQGYTVTGEPKYWAHQMPTLPLMQSRLIWELRTRCAYYSELQYISQYPKEKVVDLTKKKNQVVMVHELNQKLRRKEPGARQRLESYAKQNHMMATDVLRSKYARLTLAGDDSNSSPSSSLTTTSSQERLGFTLPGEFARRALASSSSSVPFAVTNDDLFLPASDGTEDNSVSRLSSFFLSSEASSSSSAFFEEALSNMAKPTGHSLAIQRKLRSRLASCEDERSQVPHGLSSRMEMLETASRVRPRQHEEGISDERVRGRNVRRRRVGEQWVRRDGPY